MTAAPPRPRLAVSFSGGRTSALMTKLCLEMYADTHEVVVTFANTGCEDPATLDFIDQCDRRWNVPTVWLEAVVGGDGIGIRHRVVDYFTASRKGEPFEAYIRKYGIPNAGSPQCTSRLKTEVMESYLRSIGWRSRTRYTPGEYKTAIGIRIDEFDRVSSNMDKLGFIYPLCDLGWTKAMVLAFWRQQPFDLKLRGEHYGNCVWCWKKSLRKLLTVAKETPEAFDFPARMEREHGGIKAENESGRRVFFRQERSTADILALSREPFDAYTDSRQLTLYDALDMESACGTSCEIGADE